MNQFKRYLRAFQRLWYVPVLLAVLGAAAGWLTTPEIQAPVPYYLARHTLLVEASADGTQPDVGTIAVLVGNGSVPTTVAEELGMPIEDVEDRLAGRIDESVNTVDVVAVAERPDIAVDMADTAARVLLSTLATQAENASTDAINEVNATLAEINDQITQLTGQLATATGAEAERIDAQIRSLNNQYSLAYERYSQLANQPTASSGLVTLETAAPLQITEVEYDGRIANAEAGIIERTGTGIAGEQSEFDFGSVDKETGPRRRAALGGLLGLLAGIAAVLVADRYDTRLRTKDQAEEAFGVPVLAEIPPLSAEQRKGTEVVSYTHPRSRLAESFRVIRTAILFVQSAGQAPSSEVESAADAAPPGGRVVLVTSPGPEEGKTTIIANLAAVFAESGDSVLVLNCDFRRPRIHRYLETAESTVEAQGEGGMRVVNTSIPGVKLVTGVGEGNQMTSPAEVVAQQRRIVEVARQRFDVVLLDTAPILTTNDAAQLLPVSDLVLLVAKGGRTKIHAAERCSELLARLDARVLGAVMTNSTEAPAAQYYYYYLDKSGDTERKRKADDTGRRGSGRNGSRADVPASGEVGDGGLFSR